MREEYFEKIYWLLKYSFSFNADFFGIFGYAEDNFISLVSTVNCNYVFFENLII